MRTFISHFFNILLERLGIRNKDSQTLSNIALNERIKVATAAFISLFVVSITSQYFAGYSSQVVLLASMGASAVLLFGLPSSPLAKPWSFIGGHLISAFIGVACTYMFSHFALMAATTIALVLLAMYMFECMHPPGGATALVPVIATEQGIGFDFLLLPVALNVLTMLLLAMFLNKFLMGRSLLNKKPKNFDPIHLHNDPSPLKRLGLQQEDLHYALNHYQTVIDVNESDLGQIYQQAQLHAYQRELGAIKCQDIMSKDIISVTWEVSLPKAWKLLKKHKIRTMPVVNPSGEILGVISITDFLKDIKVPHYWGLLRHMIGLSLHSEAKSRWKRINRQAVSDIMSTNVKVVKDTDHIIELIPKLSELGLHQVPVLNDEQKLVGMVTQSDLIAALYANRTLAVSD